MATAGDEVLNRDGLVQYKNRYICLQEDLETILPDRIESSILQPDLAAWPESECAQGPRSGPRSEVPNTQAPTPSSSTKQILIKWERSHTELTVYYSDSPFSSITKNGFKWF